MTIETRGTDPRRTVRAVTAILRGAAASDAADRPCSTVQVRAWRLALRSLDHLADVLADGEQATTWTAER